MQQLVGRDAELADARRRIDEATAGRGSASVLVADAGVGKSSLLDAIAAASVSMTVLRARGVEDEIGFSWSGLATLLRPLLTATVLDALPASRRRTIDAWLSTVERPTAESAIDVYSLSLAVLDLVTSSAMGAPVLILIDDLHWIDPGSASVLAFIARRLDREYVAMIATTRVVDLSFVTVPLASLMPIDAGALLGQLGVSSPSVRSDLIDAVGTNPLLLVNAASELDPDVRRGTRPLPDPLQFPRTVMDAADRRLAALEPESRRALAAIAVLSRPSLLDAERMLATVDCSMEALEAAERAEIVEVGESVRFVHPTLRTAAYRVSSAPDRRQLHGAAATVVTDPVARAVHLAASVVGRSDEIAGVLDAAADQLVHRGAVAEAAEQYGRAAQLCTDDRSAAARRIRAAELYLDLGLLERAHSLLLAVPNADADAAAHARARLLHLRERDEESCALLRSTARSLAATDPARAATLFSESLAPMVREGRAADVIETVGELIPLRPRLEGGIAARVDAMAAVFAMLGGGPADDALAAVEALLEVEPQPTAAPFVAEVLAPVLGYLGRGDALGPMMDQIERTLRDRAAIVPLIAVLGAQQLRFFGVDQPRAIGAGEEAIVLAADIGRPKLAMMAATGLSIAAGLAGDALAHHRAASLLETSDYSHARNARLAGLAVLHLSAGRHDAAVETWSQLIALHGFGDPLITFETEYLETLVRLDREDEARRLLARFDDDGTSAINPSLTDRARGVLAADDEASAEHFQRAIVLCDAARNGIDAGRAELAWGERLRRRRRRAEARPHLERALAYFRKVGLPPWSARAEIELQAAGVSTDSSLPVHALLTSQELRVARMVAEGASNREIGTELFVSQRTVETHLTSIFRKLQVRNRRELAARAVVDPDLRRDPRS